ncbi:hypothetical protein Leryth_008242 [Lithospermum erythrorhizon]|nr:hypothetical protein Leryth_008242 [Lithospermum erythrorhizon]
MATSTKTHHHLLLFLILLITTTHSLKLCPNCGSTPIPYPLSTSSDCGDHHYPLRCNDGALFFDTLNNTYPITSIFPNTQRLTIEPSPFLPNTCTTSDLTTQGIQLNATSPFNITSSNTILYLNCTNTILSSPLNCSSNSLCHVYVNSSSRAGACVNAPVCCTFKAGGSSTSHMIRVRDSGCRAYRSFVDLDDGLPVDRWPRPGVELQWLSPPEPVCETQQDCDTDATCRSDGGLRRCFCNDGFHWDPVDALCAKNGCHKPDDCDHSNKKAVIAGVTAGTGVAVIAATIAFLVYKRYRHTKEAQERLTREREEILNSGAGRSSKLFSGKEIKRATNNFFRDRLLGSGGYGEVFKGYLDDGTEVAIKCAKVGNTKSTDQVLNEVRILCQVNHKSLVHLLGCCVELEQPLLVYEFIQSGTLAEHLQGRRRGILTWNRRLSIAHETAEGLAYLHFSAVPPIYHRDVKSSNILLDEKLHAKVADFGLSRLAHTDMSHISTCAQGTLGYLDPEYYRNYQLTDKSDVYSFGVVLLELLTSQKAIDFNRPADDVNLAVYMQRLVDEERLMDAVDPMLKEGASTIELETMKALGFLGAGCLEPKRQNRPSMKEVNEEIEYLISVVTAQVPE